MGSRNGREAGLPQYVVPGLHRRQEMSQRNVGPLLEILGLTGELTAFRRCEGCPGSVTGKGGL
jgi:hypothetical protein